MKLAHILPVSLLDATPRNQQVHLALVPIVLKSMRYCSYYRNKLALGHTVILDNPVHENEEIDFSDWLTAIGLLRPTIAILPDTIDDADKTVAHAETLAAVQQETYPEVSLMAVPHGHSQADFYTCARKLARIPQVSYLGISLERRLNDDELALERRRARVNFIRTTNDFDHIKLHLLGTSENSTELVGDSHIWSRVSTADTSKFAVRYLSGIPAIPPGPTPNAYPGREPFGGGIGYFWSRPQLPLFGKRGLRNNLAAWCDYADRKEAE